MASIVPGYTYDIFISYRQKDNKGDRWAPLKNQPQFKKIMESYSGK